MATVTQRAYLDQSRNWSRTLSMDLRRIDDGLTFSSTTNDSWLIALIRSGQHYQPFKWWLLPHGLRAPVPCSWGQCSFPIGCGSAI